MKPKRWAELTNTDKANVVAMAQRRVPYADITEQTGCSVKIIRMILDCEGIIRKSTQRAIKKTAKRGGYPNNGVPSAIDSRIFLVGFDAPPAWAKRYVEAGRVHHGVQS